VAKDPALVITPDLGFGPTRIDFGAKERPTELPSGIVAMGARVYDPYTGTFLQPDPSLSIGVVLTVVSASGRSGTIVLACAVITATGGAIALLVMRFSHRS
jgi:hypothetical protein